MTLIIEAKRESSHVKSPLIREVARREGLEPERLARLIASGRVVIPANLNRNLEKRIEEGGIRGVGEFLSTKINANI
ncbi:MAG TPA: hypothetical protein ENG09_04785, partial [Candidatus Syntrophoarchaeum butanivorans]|nr:hypothetical protein [Candidatus Syntrophoarchaeum butanivorans]